MRTLLIDNYDSFTFNLHQAIATLTGQNPTVLRNDAGTWDEVRVIPCDVVIISPGPGRPDNARDFGVCESIIRAAEHPILGVCLGHQGVGHVFGANIIRAPEPVHGRLSRIHHDSSELFTGLRQGFEAVRYHSLLIAEPLPACLQRTAWTTDGLVMGVRHRDLPIWGVQFHPESICTEEGITLLGNFYRAAARALGREWAPCTSVRHRTPAERRVPRTRARNARHRVFVRRARVSVAPVVAFRELFSSRSYAYWLDSAKTDGDARFSYMGGATEETVELVQYSVATGQVTIRNHGATEVIGSSLFDLLNKRLAERRIETPNLPFDFNCGYVGYVGYETKADCGARVRHRAAQPDCQLLFADRQVVFDHAKGDIYLLYYGPDSAAEEANEWFDEVEARLAAPRLLYEPALRGDVPRLTPIQGPDRYLANIEKCFEYIRAGESYEVCLTNALQGANTVDPFDYYKVLRRTNPAPYAAFLKFGRLSVACSSPERFLKIDRRRLVVAKPIKGTAPRGRTAAEDALLFRHLREDVKSRAENLMIVDLLRNDLGRVCETGSICVPKLMDVETYATVHQLVSTVAGRLHRSRTAVDCLRHAFPGGSMTGAPKLRTMEIIDDLESAARGVYSGTIGFLALNGTADLNIVIRTAVFADDCVSIGAGGAIVALSDPEQEWQELVLKTEALVAAFHGAVEERGRVVASA